MKRLVLCIFLTSVILSFFNVAFANSGPVFWQGYPSSNIMAIQDNSPIEVKEENLLFDFSSCESGSYTVDGRVTANYKMYNPTDGTQSVQMAFPFVGSLRNLSTDDISISVDNKEVPYAVYVGNTADSYGNQSKDETKVSFDFAGIVKDITDKPYKAANFTQNEKGRLYTFEVKPKTDKGICFAVDFDFDVKKTKVLTNGFNGFQSGNKQTKITAWCYKPEMLEIFVLGEDIDLTASAFTDGGLKQKTDLFSYKISTQDVELKSYLMEYIKSNTNRKNYEKVSDVHLYNLYAKALDKYFTQNMGICSAYDLTEQEDSERILTFVYTIVFPSRGEKEVKVGYRTSGTMDKRKTEKPLYTIDYILNPAKCWSNYKNLNIRIIAPRKAPYIVESNLEFLKQGNNVYTAAFSDLPEEDLSFTLYSSEKITLIDRTKAKLKSLIYFIPLVVNALIIIFPGTIITIVILKIKRDKSRNRRL